MATPQKSSRTPSTQPPVHRLRVTCVSGPWLDDVCERIIDIPETANLYDLHIAIQDAVQFDDEFKFYYFAARSLEGSRQMVPADLPDEIEEEELDTDVYEDLAVLENLPIGAKETLFYVFLSEYDDWIFKIEHTGDVHPAVDGEFYPLVMDSLAQGPNPMEYGSGFDDYAEDAEHFQPTGFRGGDADYDPNDERDDDDYYRYRDDDEDEDGYGEDYGYGRDEDGEDEF